MPATAESRTVAFEQLFHAAVAMGACTLFPSWHIPWQSTTELWFHRIFRLIPIHHWLSFKAVRSASVSRNYKGSCSDISENCKQWRGLVTVLGIPLAKVKLQNTNKYQYRTQARGSSQLGGSLRWTGISGSSGEKKLFNRLGVELSYQYTAAFSASQKDCILDMKGMFLNTVYSNHRKEAAIMQNMHNWLILLIPYYFLFS